MNNYSINIKIKSDEPIRPEILFKLACEAEEKVKELSDYVMSKPIFVDTTHGKATYGKDVMSFVKDNIANGIDSCTKCKHFDSGDDLIGLKAGCAHPVLYNDNGDIMPAANDLIIDAMDSPNSCVLCEKK